MNAKLTQLLNYSDPIEVHKQALKFLGKDYDIFLSTRKDKKYMVKSPDGKWIHFGAFNPPMEDYTKHKNEERRNKFRNRNARWNKQDKFTAGWLAYNLLW
jgi:hypothetical protein